MLASGAAPPAAEPPAPPVDPLGPVEVEEVVFEELVVPEAAVESEPAPPTLLVVPAAGVLVVLPLPTSEPAAPPDPLGRFVPS
jgi:hypothetical protein